MYRLVVCFAWILSNVSTFPMIRSSSNCIVEQCIDYSLLDRSSNEGGCFNFQTNNNTNVCAPTSSCELLDPCNHDRSCASERAVCIVSSCCAQPVCLPLILINLCSPKNVFKETTNTYPTTSTSTSGFSIEPQTSTTTTETSTTTTETSTTTTETTTTTTEASSTSTQFLYQQRIIQKTIPASPIFYPKICPTAFWNPVGLTVASFPEITPEDFFVNQYDEIYLPDGQNRLIRKYIPGNNNSWVNVVASELLYNPTSIFVDGDENIYIWESPSSRVYFWSSMEKNLRIVLSFDGCDQSADSNKICFAKSLFVDSNRSIYISENSPNYSHANRVMKFEQNSIVGYVVAGSSTFGFDMNQLYSPGRILIDPQGMLYVADTGNSRIQKFEPGNRNGITVLVMDGLDDFIVDQDGHFYVTIKSGNILQRVNQGNVAEFLNQPTKIHFAIDGSIYVLNQGNKTIQRFQIMNNIC